MKKRICDSDAKSIASKVIAIALESNPELLEIQATIDKLFDNVLCRLIPPEHEAELAKMNQVLFPRVGKVRIYIDLRRKGGWTSSVGVDGTLSRERFVPDSAALSTAISTAEQHQLESLVARRFDISEKLRQAKSALETSIAGKNTKQVLLAMPELTEIINKVCGDPAEGGELASEHATLLNLLSKKAA